MLKENIIAFLCSTFAKGTQTRFLLVFAGRFIFPFPLYCWSQGNQHTLRRERFWLSALHAAHQHCSKQSLVLSSDLVGGGLSGDNHEGTLWGLRNWSACAPSDGVTDHCLVYGPVLANFWLSQGVWGSAFSGETPWCPQGACGPLCPPEPPSFIAPPGRWPEAGSPGCFAFYLLFWHQQWCRGDPRVWRERVGCLAPTPPAWGCAAGSTPAILSLQPLSLWPSSPTSSPPALWGGWTQPSTVVPLWVSQLLSLFLCTESYFLYFLIHTWEEFSCCQDSGWQSPELLITSEKVQSVWSLPHLTKDQPPLY